MALNDEQFRRGVQPFKGARVSKRVQVVLYIALLAAGVAYGGTFAAVAPLFMPPFAIPLAILGGLIIWALPKGDYAPKEALEPLFFAFFAALLLWPNYLAVALPGLPWLTMLRITGTPLIVCMLICLSSSDTFRARIGRALNGDRVILVMLLTFVAIQFGTLVFSNRIAHSIDKLIVAQTNWIAIFFVSCYMFSRPGFGERWARYYMALCVVACFIGVWEQRIGHVPWAGHIPSFLKIEDKGILRVLAGTARTATGIHRVTATQSTPLGCAEFLGMSAPFAIYFILGPFPVWQKALCILYLPLITAVIIFTDSRLGVVALMVTIFLYLLLWAGLYWRKHRTSLLGPAIVLAYPAIASMGFVATLVIGRLRARIWGDGSQTASTEGRKEQWRMGWPKIVSHPLGHGIGRSGETLGFVAPDGTLTIDSYYLTILLDYGLIGFIVYYGMFGRAVYTGGMGILRNPKEQELQLLLPMCVSIVSFIVIKYVFSQEDNHPLAFMLLGAVIAFAARVKAEAAVESASVSTAPRRKARGSSGRRLSPRPL